MHFFQKLQVIFAQLVLRVSRLIKIRAEPSKVFGETAPILLNLDFSASFFDEHLSSLLLLHGTPFFWSMWVASSRIFQQHHFKPVTKRPRPGADWIDLLAYRPAEQHPDVDISLLETAPARQPTIVATGQPQETPTSLQSVCKVLQVQ